MTSKRKDIRSGGEAPRTRRRFTQEFKLEAVRLASSGERRPAEVARQLGIRAVASPREMSMATGKRLLCCAKGRVEGVDQTDEAAVGLDLRQRQSGKAPNRPTERVWR